MAGIARAWLVTHTADIATLIGHHSVVIRKKWCMDKSSEGEVFIGFIMTVQTKSQIFPIFQGVTDGYGWTFFHCACHKCTGQYKGQNHFQQGLSD
jgi:hypothetical protein